MHNFVYLQNRILDDFPMNSQQLNSDFYHRTSLFNSFDYDYEKNLTSSKYVEIENRKHIERLRENEFNFLQLLISCNFEDGNTNEAIDYISKQLDKNSIATSTWIAELFSKYSNDNENIDILYGLLRTISYINKYDCFDYIKGSLMLILKVALLSKLEYLQEAALMVVEVWNTSECYSLLNSVDFSNSKYIEKYANLLKKKNQKV